MCITYSSVIERHGPVARSPASSPVKPNVMRWMNTTPCGIVSFTVEGKAARDIVVALRERRIHCSASTPSSTLLDAQARRLPDLVRASVHYYNTEAEVARFAAAVAALA